MTENHVEDVTNAAIKIGTRIIHALWGIMVMAVAAAFAIGAFITQTNLILERVQIDVGELKTLFAENIDTRLRHVENTVSQGVLPHAKEEIEMLRQRILKLEDHSQHDDQHKH